MYSSVREWGLDQIQFDLVFDRDGVIEGPTVTPVVMLLDDPAVGYRSPVTYRLRWSRAWFIFWGGPTELVDYHVVSPNQRHAYDVVIWKDGATHIGDGTRNDQYYVWGQDVLAPVNGKVGKVMSVLDDQPDRRRARRLLSLIRGPW